VALALQQSLYSNNPAGPAFSDPRAFVQQYAHSQHLQPRWLAAQQSMSNTPLSANIVLSPGQPQTCVPEPIWSNADYAHHWSDYQSQGPMAAQGSAFTTGPTMGM
jgi:hypothetical protein